MEKLQQTPSQTAGPFFAYSLTAKQYGYDYNSIIDRTLINEATKGERIYITGKVFDGKGNAISDALIELWQADADGNYVTDFTDIDFANIPFKGFGRLGTGTDPHNIFTFKTIKPGSVNGQVPHINVLLFMRGSLHKLVTRIYFSDEDNNNDALLNKVEASRRKTLVASRIIKNGTIEYVFNIYLQGEMETVFFEL